MSKELPHSLHICGRGEFGNELNFFFVNLNSPLGYDMSQHNTLVYHKMALFPVQHQIFLNAPVHDCFKVDQAFFKTTPIYSDVIHVDLHNTLHQITENTKHASLECDRGITYAEGHPSVSISPKWTGESGIFLVLCSNFNLEVPRVAIQKVVEGVP